MATNLPPFLVEYLLRQGLFSNRFSTPEDTQETPKKEQELTFEKVLQDILDGGLDTEDTTSVSSAPSPATPSTGGLGLGDIGGLFGDIEQTLSDALSFDLGQAAIDAAEDATGLDLSFEGLFGMETPSFISDIQRAMPEAVTQGILSSPNQSLGAKIGALGFNLLSPLIPAPISILGTAFNMAGATDPFDPARDVAFNFDPYGQVSTISPRASSLSEDEPDVARSELGFAADIADLAAEFGLDATISRGIGATVADYISDFGQPGSLNFGTQFGMTPDFADFGVKGISGIDKLTTSALDTLGFGGGFGAPGAFSAQPDPTSPFGYAPDYHSPSFDPSTVGPPSFESPSYSPDTGQLDFGVDSGLQGGRSAGRGGPDLSGPDLGSFGGEAEGAAGHDTDPGGDF
jgi:hypothetical protein